MNIKPTKDIILILADPPATETKSGILLKEDWRTIPPFGMVEAVGPGVKTVKVGQRVLFERYASVMLEDDYRLCKESHILAIVNEDVEG